MTVTYKVTRHQTDPPTTPHRIILPSLGSERSRAASGASKFYSNHKWNICKSSAGVWNTSSTTSETSFRSVFGPSDSPGFVQPAPGVAHGLILETRKFQSGSFTVSTCALSENLDEFHLRTLRFVLFKTCTGVFQTSRSCHSHAVQCILGMKHFLSGNKRLLCSLLVCMQL